jgi:hypothetical protein
VNGGVAIDTVVKALADYLREWATPPQRIGSVSVAKDPFHVLEILAQAPQSMRLIVGYEGCDDVGGPDDAPVVTHQVTVTLGYSLGLTAQPEKALIEDAVNRPSLLGVISEIHVHLTDFLTDAGGEDRGVRLRNIRPVVTPEGVPLAAYKMTYDFVALMQAATA